MRRVPVKNLTARIRSIRAFQYKAFEDSLQLDLAPLTVIFGRNGSGKSVVTRLPLLVATALRGEASSGPGLPLEARGLHFGTSLRSFRHGGDVERVRVEVALQRADQSVVGLHLVIGKDPDSTVNLPDQWINECHLEGGEPWRVAWDSKSRCYREGDVDSTVASFSGFIPRLQDRSAHRIAGMLRPAPSVVHLGAARDVGDDDFIASRPGVQFDVGLHGEDTRRVLGSHYSARRSETIEAVKHAVQRCVAIDLEFDEVSRGAVQATVVRARPSRRETLLPLGELGTGLAHALPVITQCAVVSTAAPDDDVPGLIVCEEPEAHLHPQAQADMADVVIDAALAGTDCLVETHSETFVLRVRRRVAEGTLTPEQVALYWVDDETASTELRRLPVASDGSVEDWPEGWFDSALDEVRAIHAAQREGA